MQTPKQQAIAFLLGALLVGGVVGFSADRAFRRDEESTIASRRKAMYDDLDLLPAQRLSMDSVFDESNCQLVAAFKPLQPAQIKRPRQIDTFERLTQLAIGTQQ